MTDQRWPRPVPVIGDPSSAQDRSADPAGWAFDAGVRDAVARVIAGRRDVRRFRPDPVPKDLLLDVLRAGHQAPSVGHSQPWRFIVVTEQRTRDAAAVLSDSERLRQADLLDADRRQRLLDLKLEGIRDAPVGIVVVCDRRVPAAGVLGRATLPDSDMWSCVAAIQNIWLTSRAAGLGLGWVTFFKPGALAELLSLPDDVEPLGWLCLGWPDERPPSPGLERRGWSSRLDLDEVVLSERWPDDDAPTSPVSHLAGPAPAEVVRARDSGDDLLAAPDALGVLDATVNRVLALGSQPPRGGTLVLVGADHPVTRYAISAYPDSVTADVLAATAAGTSLAAVTAASAGLDVVCEHAVAHDEAGDLVLADALSAADVSRLFEEGRTLGRRVAPGGLVCLGEVGIGNTTIAAALCCALLRLDPRSAVGLGVGADSDMMARKHGVLDRALARAGAAHGGRLGEPWTALKALGGPEFAMLAGVVTGAAAAGVPVVLDGLATSVAALIAVRLDPAVQSSLIAGQQSREVAHRAVLVELGLEPLLSLRLRAGEGVGACLAAQMLLSALSIRRHAARVE